MDITLSDSTRKQAIRSIERYFAENMDERIGNIAAAALLGFFVEEIGPAIYNQAVSDVQDRLQQRGHPMTSQVMDRATAASDTGLTTATALASRRRKDSVPCPRMTFFRWPSHS